MTKLEKSWLLLPGFILSYIAYLLLGALVFSTIERPVEENLKYELNLLKTQFLNQSCLNAPALENFLESVLRANKYGVSILSNASVNSNWDLASSLFFASTLLTTVGYGHTTPLSDGGKTLSIIYALFGVPFTMLVLTACVQRLMHLLTLLTSACRNRAGWTLRAVATLNFVLVLLLMVSCFLIVPALIFSSIEQSWSYLDAFYFCFISLCTIGLGDFVPGEQAAQKLRPLYKISVSVYLFLGLMFMFLVLRVFHKLADLQGLTSLFHLPHCEEDEEDQEPIMEVTEDDNAAKTEKAASQPLDPSSQVSYDSIQR